MPNGRIGPSGLPAREREEREEARKHLDGVCRYNWLAPRKLPGGRNAFGSPQECILPVGHEGHHRSAMGVITQNKEVL